MKGHVEKRGANKYIIVVELGRDADGKRDRRFTTFLGPKRAAETELVRLLHELETGVYVDPTRLKVGDYLDRWLEDYARTSVAPRTFETYQDIVNRYLRPAIGHYPLTKLRPLHIQACYAQLLRSGRKPRKKREPSEVGQTGQRQPSQTGAGDAAEKKPDGLSPRTVLHVHRVLREALRHAVQWQILAVNPADAVNPPRPEHREAVAFDEDETCRVLQAAEGTRLYTPILVAATTGLRRGELLALRWADVDLDAGTLAVRQALQVTASGVTFKQPKTAKSRRVVALGPMTVEALQKHRLDQKKDRLSKGPAWEDHDLVFPDMRGRPLHPDTFTSAWRKLAVRVGCTTSFHAFRHGHATQLLRQGIHPKIVSERLGHSSIAVTMDTYSHVLPDMQEAAAAKVDAALRLGIEKARNTAS